MVSIEPNWTGLAIFTVLWSASCIAFLCIVGMLPLGSRPETTQGPIGSSLVLCNLVMLLLLSAGTIAYAYVTIPWSSAVVSGGLIFLFAPALFQVWPNSWRDSFAGLSVLAVGQAFALALLVRGWP